MITSKTRMGAGLLANLVVFTLCMTVGMRTASAQSGTVVMPQRETTMKQALHELQRQTDYKVVLDWDDLDPGKTVFFPPRQLQVAELLRLCFAGSDLEWEVAGRHIIITRAQPDNERGVRSAMDRSDFNGTHRTFVPDPSGGMQNPAGDLFGRHAAWSHEVSGTGFPDLAIVNYRTNSSLLEPDYMDNARTLGIIHDALTDMKVLSELDHIVVTAGSSPEGHTAGNEKLAAARALAMKSYLLEKYPHLAGKIHTFSIGEDWTGLRKMIDEDPATPYRNDVLRIVGTMDGSDAKRSALQAIGAGEAYRYLATRMLPKLRGASAATLHMKEKHDPEPAERAEPVSVGKIAETEATVPQTVVVAVPESGITSAEPYQDAVAPWMAVKTNLLYGAGVLTPNLGVEFGLGRRTTLALSGGYNPWNLKGDYESNKKLVHWLVYPEFRYWLRERFDGHFFGVHALGGNYNIGGHDIPLLFDKQYRYEGYAIGGGVSYGYLWKWNHRWGMEFTLGVGAIYMGYDKYDCAKCGDKLGTFGKTYFGPTKAGITLVYMIGGKKKQPVPAPVYVAPYVPSEPVEPVVPEEPAVAVAVPQPEPEPVVIPQPTTAELLAEKHGFLAPASEFGVGFLTDRERYIEQHRDGSLSIYFRQGGKLIDHSYKDNAATLNEILSAIGQIENSSDSRVVLVVIAGFASPEGSAALNDRLAQERAVTIKNYLTDNSALSGSMVEIHNGGIDWSGLHKLVEASDMAYRQQVLNIIDNTPIWDARRNAGRHGELMRLGGGEPYRYMLRNFFPELRNATYIRVYFENTPK